MMATEPNSYTFQKSSVWYFSRRVHADLRWHYITGRVAYSSSGSQPALTNPSIKVSAKVELGTKIFL